MPNIVRWKIIVAIALMICSNVLPLTQHAKAATPKNAAWLWRSMEQIPQTERQALIQFAKAQNIQVLFIAIDKYPTLYRADGPTRDTDLTAFITAQKEFIQLAHQNGISVQALGGDPSWSQPAYRFFPKMLLEFVAKHNATQDPVYRYDGLQLDIEPYAQAGFDSRRTTALIEFLDTAQLLIDDQKKWQTMYGTNGKVPLGFSIPYWLDGTHPDMPLIRRNKRREPVTQHLMRILNQTTGNYVAVMAYRDFALGVNGTIDLSQKEIAFAETTTKNVGVYVGQETDRVEPEHITFHEEGMAALKTEMEKINASFSMKPPYQGIALHHLDSLRMLKP